MPTTHKDALSRVSSFIGKPCHGTLELDGEERPQNLVIFDWSKVDEDQKMEFLGDVFGVCALSFSATGRTDHSTAIDLCTRVQLGRLTLGRDAHAWIAAGALARVHVPMQFLSNGAVEPFGEASVGFLVPLIDRDIGSIEVPLVIPAVGLGVGARF